MSKIKLRQLQFESDTWKRLLAFMMDENIHLKNRISEILSADFQQDLLDILEDYQTSLIKDDTQISLLRNDVAEFDKLLAQEIVEDGKILKEIKIKLKTIRHDIVAAERFFNNLKLSFNNYL